MKKNASYQIKSILLGLGITIGVSVIGIALTSLINHIAAFIVLSFILTPTIAIYILLYSRFKFVAIGILAGLIPIGIFSYFVHTLSQLH